jgi:hypothetical protein
MARAGLPAALILGALVLSTPAAVAAEDGEVQVRIEPRSAQAGATVTVSTTGCGEETYGKGESAAGGNFHLFEGDRKGVLEGEFTLPEGVEPGADTVTLKCPPRVKLTGTYQISDSPRGAVEAGFGSGSGSGSTTQLAVGGVLLAGAFAGTLVRMRRRAGGAVV